MLCQENERFLEDHSSISLVTVLADSANKMRPLCWGIVVEDVSMPPLQDTPSEDDILILNSRLNLESDGPITKSELHFPLVLEHVLNCDRVVSEAYGMTRSLRTIDQCLKRAIQIQLGYAYSQNYTEVKQQVFKAFNENFVSKTFPYSITNLLYLSEQLSRVISKSNEMFDRKYYNISSDERVELLLSINNYNIK